MQRRQETKLSRSQPNVDSGPQSILYLQLTDAETLPRHFCPPFAPTHFKDEQTGKTSCPPLLPASDRGLEWIRKISLGCMFFTPAGLTRASSVHYRKNPASASTKKAPILGYRMEVAREKFQLEHVGFLLEKKTKFSGYTCTGEGK